MDSKEARKVDPFTAYGVAAASMAVEDAGLDKFSFDQERAGVLVSSGIGGMKYLQTQHKRALEEVQKSLATINSSNDNKYFSWIYINEVQI